MLIERVTPLRGEMNDSFKAYCARGGFSHNLSSISSQVENVLAALARLNSLNLEARTMTKPQVPLSSHQVS